MNTRPAAGDGAEGDGQLLPQRVAELAGELAEAGDEPQRRRLARQLAELAGRSGQATARSVAAGSGAGWRGVRAGARTVARRVRPATGATAGRVRATGVSTRRRMLAGGAATGHGLRATGEWLSAQVIDMAPRVPIRDIGTLRRHYPGLDTEKLADRLITDAARASAGIGAAVGAAAVIPTVPAMAMELGVETLALVAVELKLIAELHEVYGYRAPGSRLQRTRAYLTAWSQRRGVRLTGEGVSIAVGSPVRRQLERRLLARAGQGTLALTPLLAGVVAGAVIDHHETRRLGTLIRNDLRRRGPSQPG